MDKRNPEGLSDFSMLAIALTVAVIGLAGYMLVAPLTPTERIAVGHAAVMNTGRTIR